MNPLLKDFEYVPFGEIGGEHYLPAIRDAILQAKKEIEEIKTRDASFEDTVVALENSGARIERIAEIFSNMLAAETSDSLQEIAKEFMPLLTNYSTDVLQDRELFSKVEQVYYAKETQTGEARMLLEKTYKSFIRGGAKLGNDAKNRLREIDEELSVISLRFGENVLKETNEYYLLVEDEAKLAGIPERSIEGARKKAEEKGVERGWAFTLDFPSYLPFVTYCQDRKLREEIYCALTSRCATDQETNNQENIKKIVALRAQRAQLLGYETHADYVLSERMAKDSQTVGDFLEELRCKALGKAQADMVELKNYAKNLDGIEDFASWDHYYYFEKLKKEKFNIDDEILRPYFSLEKVIDGVFVIAQKLYGISFEETKEIPLYHEDVKTYQVFDVDGSSLGLLYADFFPRAGKRNGAWMTEFRKQSVNKKGDDVRPHVAIVCNFTPPANQTPSLLSFAEARTLFHEFGHALHGLLSKCHYASLSGPSVYWDFVELPSQIMENWLYEPEALNVFAKHWETGQVIETDLVKKIKQSASFFEAVQTIRQLGFGLLDMAWHTIKTDHVDNVHEFENEIMSQVALLPLVNGANMSCSFGHIFNGGYSAGYYSYKWAEVLDADAFELFQIEGIFNKDVAKSFRENILSRGGSCHPMELYKKFRGREPKNEALLRRSGISF